MKNESLILIQSDIDDDTAENLASFAERVLEAGANDCVLIPVIMKKSRPGVRIEILCKPDDAEKFGEMLLLNTTSVGYRCLPVDRYPLDRRTIDVVFEGHRICCKVVEKDGQIVRWKPEHDDCDKASRVLGISVGDVKQQASELARQQLTRDS